MKNKWFHRILVPLAAAALAGCAGLPGGLGAGPGKGAEASAAQEPAPAPKAARRVETFRRPAGKTAGGSGQPEAEAVSFESASLWSDKSPFLFADRRASRVGDIVTVVISESSNAKKEADTELTKKSSLAFTVPALPGYGEILGTQGPEAKRARRFDPADTLRTTSDSAHDTETEITRTDTLSATIAAKVVEVFPNGNLLIEGRREITTHQETLIVTVSGIVRPDDIDADNVVLSKNIADARVVYTGEGIAGEVQSPGWLTRVVHLLWPF